MPRFQLKQSSRMNLTSYGGLALLGQCFEAAQVDTVMDGRVAVSQGIRASSLVKTAVALLSLGKGDFEAVEPFREDRFFREALGVPKVPSAVWLRQRLDSQAGAIRAASQELSQRLLERTGAPITPRDGYVCLDIDTFVMDQSGSRKEYVGRTYQGIDGYTPIAAYLGNEGWCLALELRPGTQHSALETEYTLERVMPQVARLVPANQPVLMREDSGFDSNKLLFWHAAEQDRWAEAGRSLHFIIKWNPRKQHLANWVRQAEAAHAFRTVREGKREAWLSMSVERAFGKQRRTFRRVVKITERTSTAQGQRLLMPDIELEGWWTSLDLDPETVAAWYHDHGTHEQFHSEIKSDLDLERLPSGKFDTNDAWLHLAAFAYNCLRLLGQFGLNGDLTPLRHPAKRRRLKTVLQEIMYCAARYVFHARQRILDFGHGVSTHVAVFEQVQQRLRRCVAT